MSEGLKAIEKALDDFIFERSCDFVEKKLGENPFYIQHHNDVLDLYKKIDQHMGENSEAKQLFMKVDEVFGSLESLEIELSYQQGFKDALNLKNLINLGIA